MPEIQKGPLTRQCWHPNFSLPASRTVSDTFLLVIRKQINLNLVSYEFTKDMKVCEDLLCEKDRIRKKEEKTYYERKRTR